jgi:hypothetical protein
MFLNHSFPYRYAWNRMDRKGQLCRVIVRGKMNSCWVQFEDGHEAVTSRNALRKVQPAMPVLHSPLEEPPQ